MPEPVDRAARPSRRRLKYALYVFAAVLLLLGGAAAYLVATFDPRDYERHIVELVREKTGRTLELKGELALTFWPDVAVRLGALTLSERDGTERFVTVDNARLRLELRPLLDRELVVSELVVSGAAVRIVRDENGRLNIQDLLEGEGAPPRFDIGRIAVDRSVLTLSDVATGVRYDFTQIALETGRIAPGLTSPVSLAFAGRDAGGGADVKVALKGRVELDFENKRHALHGARVDVTGRIGDFNDMTAQVNGSFAAHAGNLGATDLALKAQGEYGGERIAATLETQRLALSPGTASGEMLRASLRAEGAAGTTDLKLATPALKRGADRIESAGVDLELSIERGAHRVHGTVSSPLEAFVAARQLAFVGLDAALTVTGPRLPRNGVRANVQGEARLDLRKEGVALRLAGTVAESRVKAQIAAAGFASPVYTFAVNVDRLDLDRYLADAGAGRTPPRAARSAQEHLLAPLAELPASGTLDIGALKVSNTSARNVRLTLE